MRGNEKVLEYLNLALKHELTAVNQYWLHYRIFDNWGYKEFAKKWRAESVEEMQHADRLVARILFLEGLPNMQDLAHVQVGQTVEEILAADLATELSAHRLYTEAADYCFSVRDYVSKELFDHLLEDEEEHIDFLEAQQELVRQVGIQLYAQKHIGGLGD